jgi:two-component system, chemotaxis family, CheB/CheR fusion protein
LVNVLKVGRIVGLHMTAEHADSAELRRRIRRLLAVIRSLATDMQIQSREVHESARHLADRVSAVGRAAVASISSGMDLESLVLDELLAHGIDQSAAAVEGPAVRLNAKSAEVMALVIHELATNAIKFGALSQPQSRLHVIWWLGESAAPHLHFEWAEKGVRMAAMEKFNPGFGSQVVQRLIARELHGNGKMDFLPDGLLCTVEIPSAKALHKYE